MDVGKKVRLIAGAAGMAPALGLAVAAPASAAPVHAPGKKASLQVGHAGAATKCTGNFSKIATAASTNFVLSAAHEGSCVLAVSGFLRLSGSPSPGDIMRVRVFDHGTRVFSSRVPMFVSSGTVLGNMPVGVIGQKVCAAAFSHDHPTKKIAGPVCVKI